MIKHILLLMAFYSCVSVGSAYAWNIQDYKIDINLDKDSSFVVKEEIDVDFGYESKHGIYRDIPIAYNDENGRPYNVSFDSISVQDENQNARQYAEEGNGNYKRLKIGSPYSTVSGKQVYVISYRVAGAVLSFPDHDEIYWNAVGPQWNVDIDHVLVSLNLPQAVSKDSLKLTSYTGRQGSRTSNARADIVSENLIRFEGEHYSPNEGFTIVVGLPKGVLTVPPRTYQPPPAYNPPYEQPGPPVGPWALLISLATLIMMWCFKNINSENDPQLNKSVVVEYKAPEGLRPALMATIIGTGLEQRDITSTIIDLSIRGYLKIVQKSGTILGKEYSFVLLKTFENDNTLLSYEEMILQEIFGESPVSSEVKLSDLNNKFYMKLGAIEENIANELKSRKIPVHRAEVNPVYAVIGIILFVGAICTILVDLWLMLALILSAFIVILFGSFPHRTAQEVEILSKVLGFKEFLKRTEQAQIKQDDQQGIFEQMLPYAICLGISTTWAKKFQGLYTQPPYWFSGDYRNGFMYDHFMHDLDNSLSSMGSSLYSSPQTVSSGGGFSGGGCSGGGGGGGGGGSW